MHFIKQYFACPIKSVCKNFPASEHLKIIKKTPKFCVFSSEYKVSLVDKHFTFYLFCISKPGVGCQNLNCPGDPDCNAKGRCIVDDTTGTPICVCEEGWVGGGCEIRCEHGSATEENPDVCICDPCYAGFNCDRLCSGRVNATCVDNKCVCGFEGWRGDLCDVPGKLTVLCQYT